MSKYKWAKLVRKQGNSINLARYQLFKNCWDKDTSIIVNPRHFFCRHTFETSDSHMHAGSDVGACWFLNLFLEVIQESSPTSMVLHYLSACCTQLCMRRVHKSQHWNFSYRWWEPYVGPAEADMHLNYVAVT